MAKLVNTSYELAPYSFLALMAGEGKLPGTVSGSKEKMILTVAVEETAREVISDLTAEGDFFSLMVANGLMSPAAPKKKINIKIVRPTNLGGGFGGFGGGSFGNGALAH